MFILQIDDKETVIKWITESNVRKLRVPLPLLLAYREFGRRWFWLISLRLHTRVLVLVIELILLILATLMTEWPTRHCFIWIIAIETLIYRSIVDGIAYIDKFRVRVRFISSIRWTHCRNHFGISWIQTCIRLLWLRRQSYSVLIVLIWT